MKEIINPFNETEYSQYYNFIDMSLFSYSNNYYYFGDYLIDYFSLDKKNIEKTIKEKENKIKMSQSNKIGLKHFIITTYLFFLSNDSSCQYKYDFSEDLYAEFYKYTYYVFKYYISSYIKKLGIQSEDELKQYELLDNIFYFIPNDYKFEDNINSENYYIKKYLQFLEYEEYMDIDIDEEYDNKEKRYQKIFDLMLSFYSYIECNILDD